MTEPAHETIEKVGPYRIIKAIGAGGTARIDLARIDRAYNFQRHVVVKRPLEHLRDDPAVAASLRREAKLGGQLRHPNLVAVLDAGTHENYDYLVLEYVHGSSLRALMQAHATDDAKAVRALPLATALSIIVDTARGMHAAHELTGDGGHSLGLVHRDVSPGNILVGHDGTVKLADFGIAKETHVSTLSGSLQGTVTYMAPEQCRGHAFDRRADLFSLGVILFELVTQRRLFLADNDVASLHLVLSGAVPPPRQLVPNLPPALEALMLHALAPDPSARIATAKELADRLESFAAGAGLVLGARRIERLVEDQLGAKRTPWVKSTTDVDMPAQAEPSLVAVIAAVPPAPPASPTFDDDALPGPPTAAPRSRRRMIIALMAAAIAIGVGVAIVMVPAKDTANDPAKDKERPTSTTVAPVVTVPEPVVTVPVPVAPVTPPPLATPEPAPLEPAVAIPTPPPEPKLTPRPKTPALAHHEPHRLAPLTPGPPVAPSVPHLGSGSAAPPPQVEWRPSLMLPTDSGSGHAGSRH